ncbi:hypothetical protein PMAYCL1PPCAC_26998 [Pristionchus mayeri]|uniref:F-box domain-containing protein n=1 Tax=Pristionchus mayeri TaxID=1317129 RepID=A0AAN5I8R4_9BILA|nr:hypothetical protein PMAYCL1PPCAC_26997 [Pristionchus mayeri]GMR56803.1 hypothetical protein PMAYCL1PPCAC_26998 [Pristionchus mayeri]
MEQFFNLLELPREMITEVVKRADYEGLLALREVCILTKELVDEESRKIDPVRKICFNDPSRGRDCELTITLDRSSMPICLLKCIGNKQLERKRRVVYKNNIHICLQFSQQTLPEFLFSLRDEIQSCQIESFSFLSPDEFYIAHFASFLEGLSIKTGCLTLAYCYDKYWNIAFDTISRLKLNSVYMGVHNSMEQKLQIADAVDGLILFKDHHKRPENPVAQAVQLLSRRCSHLELEAAWLSEDEMEQAIRELARFDKKVYLYTRVSNEVTNRTVKVGSLNVNVVGNYHLEIYHDGMRRRDIS